jgi:DHA2 family methylenomycin A resistance protein-like MFS transporter
MAAESDQRTRTATLIAASLGFAVIQLDVFVVNVGVKQIGASLGGGTASLQWVVGAYTLFFAACILTAGAAGDRLGAKRVYGAGFVVFVAASVACGLAPSMPVLVAARAVQGIGAAMLGACSLALINHTFHDNSQRARAVGMWAAGASVALSAGPIVGGLLIASIGWRSIFFINVPLGALGWYLTRRFAAESESIPRKVDVRGQLLAIAAMVALAGGLIEGGSVGFGDPPVVAAIGVAAALLVGFFVVEATTAEPLLPLSYFRRPSFAAPALLGLVVNVAFYGLIFVFSLYFQRIQGDSALRAGLAFLPLTVVVLLANLGSGWLAERIGVRQVIWGGLAAMAVGCAGLLIVHASTPLAALALQQLLVGGGLGIVVPQMTHALMSSVDRSRSGMASGTLNTTRQTGSVLGVAIFGSLVATRAHFIAGFHQVLLISLGLIALGMLLTWSIGRPEPVSAPEREPEASTRA